MPERLEVLDWTGVRDGLAQRPFAALAREFLGDFLAFDARIWRTLGALVARPGLVTRDTIEGRRARWMPPFRLYVFAGFVYFGVMALTGGGLLAPQIRSDAGRTVISFGGAPIRTGLMTGDAGTSPAEGSNLAARLDERAATAARDQEAFGRAIIGSLSYGHFLLSPIFALLLKLFYRRRYYVEHLIFSLHYHAVVLLTGALVVAGSVAQPFARTDLASRAIVSLWTLFLAAVLFVALRRVYGESRLRTALKLPPLGIAYGAISGIVILAVTAGTLWFY